MGPHQTCQHRDSHEAGFVRGQRQGEESRRNQRRRESASWSALALSAERDDPRRQYARRDQQVRQSTQLQHGFAVEADAQCEQHGGSGGHRRPERSPKQRERQGRVERVQQNVRPVERVGSQSKGRKLDVEHELRQWPVVRGNPRSNELGGVLLGCDRRLEQHEVSFPEAVIENRPEGEQGAKHAGEQNAEVGRGARAHGCTSAARRVRGRASRSKRTSGAPR